MTDSLHCATSKCCAQVAGRAQGVHRSFGGLWPVAVTEVPCSLPSGRPVMLPAQQHHELPPQAACPAYQQGLVASLLPNSSPRQGGCRGRHQSKVEILKSVNALHAATQEVSTATWRHQIICRGVSGQPVGHGSPSSFAAAAMQLKRLHITKLLAAEWHPAEFLSHCGSGDLLNAC